MSFKTLKKLQLRPKVEVLTINYKSDPVLRLFYSHMVHLCFKNEAFFVRSTNTLIFKVLLDPSCDMENLENSNYFCLFDKKCNDFMKKVLFVRMSARQYKFLIVPWSLEFL